MLPLNATLQASSRYFQILQKKHMISSGLSHGSQEIKRGQGGAAPGASGAWGPGHLWLEKGSHSLLQEPSPPRDQTQVSCIVGRFFTI